MIKRIVSILLFAVISISVNNIYSTFAQSNNTATITNPDIDAKTIYEQKSAVLGNDIKNFVILIPDEGHESTNQPKKQYPLANQPYIPQSTTVNKGTSLTWFSGDVDHDHIIKFKSPNSQNLDTTSSFPFTGYTTINFNQTGQYSYYEDNVNKDDTSFVMEGKINVVDSNEKTPINSSNNTQDINTIGVLMVPSKDFQSISSTLKNSGIVTLSDYTFTDLRGGQKGTGPTQTIIVWGSEKDNVDQALAPIIDVTKGLPYS